MIEQWRPLDHMKLVKRQPKEVARMLRAYSPVGGVIRDLPILHEADDSCCTRERWALTLMQLLMEARR